jgi:phosphoribosylformylglycinamidine synthase subunit PurSL
VRARLTITPEGRDPRSAGLLVDAHALGLEHVEGLVARDIIFLEGQLDGPTIAQLDALLIDPLLQHGTWGLPAPQLDTQVIETMLHPGVTDSAAMAVLHAAKRLGLGVTGAATGKRFEVTGPLDSGDIDRLVRRLLANAVIESWAYDEISVKDLEIAPAAGRTVANDHSVAVIGLSADELQVLNIDRGLSLDPEELLVVQKHFVGVGREPTDVELEMLAQTWSEHCAHKTFRAAITDTRGNRIVPLIDQLRNATNTINAPFLVSAFVGNAGIVRFTPGRTIAIKAETHNHPSAVEPFGGANTGVGGVIRDILGAAHLPVACTDVLCFGPADLASAELPDGVLHPRRIRAGVVAGVADYGNKIGLPTVAGAVLYDPGYTANPLVFCGCIGVATDSPILDGPHPGDRVIVLGGRTGRDGLRGATFSSRSMDASTGEVAGASVQIGDPIIEKLLIDVIGEAAGLYTAITDCGAGGLSSAVGEMAEIVGANVDLALAPLKYPALAPWEIWLSEAQERMVVSVRPEKLAELERLCSRHGVELADIGLFTGDGTIVVHHGDEVVAAIDGEFLHNGRPRRNMVAELSQPNRTDPAGRTVDDPLQTLLALLAHPNISSKAAIIRRYDHEIGGATLARPLTGLHQDGPGDGVVLANPLDTFGMAIGIGVNPWYGIHDPERMAWAAVDEAMRNLVVTGADPDMVCLLDNFSWGDPRRPSTLGGLVDAVRGCVDASLAFAAPFVSGKDSLNNEYLTLAGTRTSVPPTLVITAVGHVPDAGKVVTPDLKAAGNLLVLVGSTRCEFAGSHLDLVQISAADHPAGVVPQPDLDAPARYRRLHQAILAGLICSAHDCSEGGLGVALAEMAISGCLGASIDQLPVDDVVTSLFAESVGRIVLEVAPASLEQLRAVLDEPLLVLGTVDADPRLLIAGAGAASVDALRAAFIGNAG